MPIFDNPVVPPARVRERPSPESWDPNEPLTFAEAAALLWPRGPITAWTLRTAYRQGALPVLVVARKLFVTRALVAEWLAGARREGGGDDGRPQ